MKYNNSYIKMILKNRRKMEKMGKESEEQVVILRCTLFFFFLHEQFFLKY